MCPKVGVQVLRYTHAFVDTVFFVIFQAVCWKQRLLCTSSLVEARHHDKPKGKITVFLFSMYSISCSAEPIRKVWAIPIKQNKVLKKT